MAPTGHLDQHDHFDHRERLLKATKLKKVQVVVYACLCMTRLKRNLRLDRCVICDQPEEFITEVPECELLR